MRITFVALVFLIAIGGTGLSGCSTYDEIACAANANCSYDSQPLTMEEVKGGTWKLIKDGTRKYISNVSIPELVQFLMK